MPVCPKHSCRDARSTMVSERDFHIVPTMYIERGRRWTWQRAAQFSVVPGSTVPAAVRRRNKPVRTRTCRYTAPSADWKNRRVALGRNRDGLLQCLQTKHIVRCKLEILGWAVEFDCWIEQPVNSFTESFSEFARSQTSISLSASMGRRAILESGDGSRAGFVSVS